MTVTERGPPSVRRYENTISFQASGTPGKHQWLQSRIVEGWLYVPICASLRNAPIEVTFNTITGTRIVATMPAMMSPNSLLSVPFASNDGSVVTLHSFWLAPLPYHLNISASFFNFWLLGLYCPLNMIFTDFENATLYFPTCNQNLISLGLFANCAQLLVKKNWSHFLYVFNFSKKKKNSHLIYNTLHYRTCPWKQETTLISPRKQHKVSPKTL